MFVPVPSLNDLPMFSHLTFRKEPKPEVMMRDDTLAHCRRACRPSLVWVQLCLISRKYDLDDGVIQVIHAFVSTSMTAEKDGMLAFKERKEREEASRREQGAEKALPLYRILGFRTLSGYMSHLYMEKKAEQDREMEKIPDWLKFGFSSVVEFKRARRLALRW